MSSRRCCTASASFLACAQRDTGHRTWRPFRTGGQAARLQRQLGPLTVARRGRRARHNLPDGHWAPLHATLYRAHNTEQGSYWKAGFVGWKCKALHLFRQLGDLVGQPDAVAPVVRDSLCLHLLAEPPHMLAVHSWGNIAHSGTDVGTAWWQTKANCDRKLADVAAMGGGTID